MRKIHKRSTAVLLIALVAGGCAAGGGTPVTERVSSEEAMVGTLRIFMTDQTTDGRNLKLRGKIINPYAEPIEGVRLVYLDIGAGDEPRILNHVLKIIDQGIDAGGSRMFRWDIQSMYIGTAGARFNLLAFAIKRNGKELPLPPGWEAGDDEATRAAGQ